MNLRPERRGDPEINVMPLIDVVFLLLIFFMVSTTFEHQSRIEIELPEASTEPSPEPDDVLEIVIDARGQYFIGDEQVVNTTLKTLKGAIRQALGDHKELPVVIRADANTPHQAVITALDASSQLGLVQISLATVQSREEE
jgi:biopolymer transport protein ExbD